jgi:putative ABC transport system substrate-binding protein
VRRGPLAATALVALSLAACGGDDDQPDRTIAFLRTTPIAQESQDALLDELAAAGWRLGDNLIVLNEDPESGYEDADEATEAARGFVEDGADLLIALSTTAAMAAVDATSDVPVLVLANDPVASGLVTNPREPEANVTGVSFRVPGDRTIDVSRELVAGDDPIGLLWPADDPGAAPIVETLREAATTLDAELLDRSFANDGEIAGALADLAESGVEVVILANAPATVRAFEVIEREATAAGLATVSNTNANSFSVVVLAPDNLTCYRQLGRQAVRLLSETTVDEVPVEDPGDFNLVVRPSAAEDLGFEIPDDLTQQADAVED